MAAMQRVCDGKGKSRQAGLGALGDTDCGQRQEELLRFVFYHEAGPDPARVRDG